MTNTKRVSVIIPVYNGEKFISSAITSILDQSYPAHEIIVINDGSVDNTLAILNRFQDKIIVRSTENKGISAARNLAISLSTGEYLAFLDADDIWFKNKLKEQMQVFTKFPQIGITCSDYISRYDYLGNKRLRHFSTLQNTANLNFDEPLVQNFAKNIIFENFIGTPSSVIVKKSTLLKTKQFDCRHRHSEDIDLWIRMSMVSNCILINKVLLYKRTHDDNLTNDKERFYSGDKYVLNTLLAEYPDYFNVDNLQQTAKSRLAIISYKLGNAYFENHKIVKAYNEYYTALMNDFTARNFVSFIAIILRKTIRLLSFNLTARNSWIVSLITSNTKGNTKKINANM